MGRFHRIFYHLFIFHMSELLTLFFRLTIIPFVFSEDNTFKKKRPLINSTNLNKLLRSPIYPHLDGQLRAAYLILRYSPAYQSFQAVGRAIAKNHPLLPYIDIRSKGYILSPSERARRKKVKGAAILHLLLP